MTKQNEQTEVVKIRLGSDDKVRLQEIAEKEFRSFAGVFKRCYPFVIGDGRGRRPVKPQIRSEARQKRGLK